MKQTELFNVQAEDTFSIAGIEFIKFSDEDGITTAVTKGDVFKSRFGESNNFAESDILKRLETELLPKLADAIGMENICDITTDLTTLDGLEDYGKMTSKISLPTADFYRVNRSTFDKYKLDMWWWLATANGVNFPWVFCVSLDGFLYYYFYDYVNLVVRPFLRFVSSIFVSCED